jgi:crossover junction endodeoxyribonuclease RusA
VVLTFHAFGAAATQGSMKSLGRGRMAHSNPRLGAWRKTLIHHAQQAMGKDWEPLDGPLIVHLDVYLRRPKSTKFKDYPAGAPDLDKLQRAVGDALTMSGAIKDDARIVSWHAHKKWAVGIEPGAYITIYEKDDLK